MSKAVFNLAAGTDVAQIGQIHYGMEEMNLMHFAQMHSGADLADFAQIHSGKDLVDEGYDHGPLQGPLSPTSHS